MSNIQNLQVLYVEALDFYKTELDNDGDVIIKVPDLGTLYLSLYEDDPEYFRLVYPNFFDSQMAYENYGADEALLRSVVNEVNRSCKGAFLTLFRPSEDRPWDVSASVEAFLAPANSLPDIELVKATFGRNVAVIQAARRRLHELLQEYAQGRAN